jgi:hypothetical protein
MRILLLGHGRCGSTSLQLGLSDVLQMDNIIEPFNEHLWGSIYNQPPPYNEGDDIPDNVVFKTISGPGFNNDWVISNYKKFDVVILLLRANIRETLISHTNAKLYGYSHNYKPVDHITYESIDYVSGNYSWLFDFYTKSSNVTLIWYEDLYKDFKSATTALSSIGLRLTSTQMKSIWDEYLNPKHRLRQT